MIQQGGLHVRIDFERRLELLYSLMKSINKLFIGANIMFVTGGCVMMNDAHRKEMIK